MSLRWRILGAFFLIIVLAVIVSIGVGYFTTQSQLDSFVAGISDTEANDLAQKLSQGYTRNGDWNSVEEILAEAGYLYGEDTVEERFHDEESSHEEEKGTIELFHNDPIRVVILDVEGSVLWDNFSELIVGVTAPEMGGQRVTLFDLESRTAVGYVYVDVNHDFLATESHGFLTGTLTTTIIGGLLTAMLALLMAFWLARRITAPVTALTRATQVIARQGETDQLAVASRDELGQMSDAFNQMTAALQTQRDLRRRLIDDVSHELNTPLSVINLEAKGLLDGLQTPELAANRIIQEVSMLRNLVRDLNWLAETDSGEARMDIEPCSVPQLLETEVERRQPQARAHQVTLSLDLFAELPVLDLDPVRMSQAIGNVIHNALQHTEAGGQVTVSAGTSTGGQVEISVTDDGIGIDEADLPHVFDRFFRTDESLNREVYGTGLGLSIAREIIEAHAGSILVTSAGIGEGTTVKFGIPLPD